MKNLICVSLYDNLSMKVYNLSEVNNKDGYMYLVQSLAIGWRDMDFSQGQ